MAKTIIAIGADHIYCLFKRNIMRNCCYLKYYLLLKLPISILTIYFSSFQFDLRLARDGSGKGAALVAAIANKLRNNKWVYIMKIISKKTRIVFQYQWFVNFFTLKIKKNKDYQLSNIVNTFFSYVLFLWEKRIFIKIKFQLFSLKVCLSYYLLHKLIFSLIGLAYMIF